MDKLYQFYENELGGKDFYGILERKSLENSTRFNQSILFPKLHSSSSINYSESEKVFCGDLRIDMPLLCGSPNSKLKILFLGLVY